MDTPIHVVGMGLEGTQGLAPEVRDLIKRAALLVGSDRHLQFFPEHPAPRLCLSDLSQTLQTLRETALCPTPPPTPIVILTSGDPLFYGLGRLLLEELPPDWLTFHPHLSSIQLAFSRVKTAWQDARIISAHGRSLEELTRVLQQGTEKIAVLTDGTNTPAAIARLLCSLDLPSAYHCWVCENLGGSQERVQRFAPEELLQSHPFAPLNVVVLLRGEQARSLDLQALPLLGIPDSCFLSFGDRPGLITKREVRLQVLGELGLRPNQTIWDIGAGTGSVSVEIARLCPTSRVFAIEKTAAGIALIQQNCRRFQVETVVPVTGTAPRVLSALPAPDRVFVGGSGGNLSEILEVCASRLQPEGAIVLALATLEHCAGVFDWARQRHWPYRVVQVNLARSVSLPSPRDPEVSPLTRLAPLNPVTLIRLDNPGSPAH